MHTNTYIHICIYIHICKHKHLHAYVCVCICIYIYMNTNIYIYMYIHLCVNTHTNMFMCLAGSLIPLELIAPKSLSLCGLFDSFISVTAAIRGTLLPSPPQVPKYWGPKGSSIRILSPGNWGPFGGAIRLEKGGEAMCSPSMHEKGKKVPVCACPSACPPLSSVSLFGPSPSRLSSNNP